MNKVQKPVILACCMDGQQAVCCEVLLGLSIYQDLNVTNCLEVTFSHFKFLMHNVGSGSAVSSFSCIMHCVRSNSS